MSSPSDPSDSFDADFWQRFRQRDRLVFQQVFACYHPRLLAYLWARCHPPLDPDGIAGATWLKVWMNPAYDPAQGPFFAWLHKVAQNIIVSTTRTKKFTKLKQTTALAEGMDPASCESDVLSEREPDERLRALRDCLGRIGHECQELLRRDIEGLKGREIAETLKIPEGTVASRKSRCKQRLRECIEKQLS